MITERLARFLVEHRPEHLPERVRHEAKRSLVNFFATALGGCRNEAVEILISVNIRCFRRTSIEVILHYNPKYLPGALRVIACRRQLLSPSD